MYTILSNLLLTLSACVFGLLLFSLYAKHVPKGGDAVVGYGWSVILLNLVFLVLLGLATLVLTLKGAFDWVSPVPAKRNALVFVGLLVCVASAALCGLFRHESGPISLVFRGMTYFAHMLIPAVLILSGFVLANDGLREALPKGVYLYPLKAVFGLGVLGVGLFLWDLMGQINQNNRRTIAEMGERELRIHNSHLADIDSCDVSKDMVLILVLTDSNHDQDVRERALAKIKTRPDWQAELVRRLDSGWASQVFIFLASNEVDDKQLFAEPIRSGILNQAAAIRESIRQSFHSSNFYPDRFSGEIDRAIRTVEKFKGMGVDYLPAMRELRAALDEPCKVEKSKMDCTATLDRWINKNQ